MRRKWYRTRRTSQEPGPARPITYVVVAFLSVVIFLVVYSMAQHHFLLSSRYNYYNEHVKTPWHFAARSPRDR